MARYDLMLGVTSAEAFVLLNQEVFQRHTMYHHHYCLDQDHHSDPDQDHHQDHDDQNDDFQEMELGLETEGRNKLVSDFVTATFQVILIIIIIIKNLMMIMMTIMTIMMMIMKLMRMMFQHHQKEIFSAILTEYTDWASVSRWISSSYIIIIT